jgi:Right handed beta helix region
MPATVSILCFLLCFSASATTYYCSNAGSDQNAGTSDSASFATLSYAKTKLHSGDTLLLKRQDVFRDSLDLSALTNPVVGAYGPTGSSRPVVSGSIAISGWTAYKGSIWAASCVRRIQKLFANNAMMTLARYPDTGWLRPDTMTENADGSGTVISVAALAQHAGNAAGYWTNAQIRWRRWSWWFETRQISNYDGAGRLALAGKSVIHIDPADGTRGWGFYIDNKFEELDAPGEWFYDTAAKKVYFYPPGGVDPNTMLVEGAFLSSGIRLGGGSVDNICLQHQLVNGISLSKTSVISNCRFEGTGGDSGGSALAGSWDIANSHIFNNVFENNLNIGISWYENSGRLGQSVIEYDTLINTGSFPGYGGTGTWHAVGILVHLSAGVQVRYNYIDKTGYAGVLLGSDSNFVYCNIIKNAMFTLNDGGAIYTDCSRSFIHNNIIYDSKGDLTSSGPWYPLGQGIWLEFLGDYHRSVVENNTVVRSGCNGIFLPNNFSDTVRNNVLFDNAVAQIDLDGQLTNSSTGRTVNSPQNNSIQGNVFYASKRSEMTLEFRPEYNYGALSGNYFCDPYTDSVVSGYGTGNNYYTQYDYTLGQWRSLYPAWADAFAKTDPIKRPAAMSANKPYGQGTIFVNETPSQTTVALGAALWVDLDGNPVSGSITLAPFTSQVLVCSDSTLGVSSREAQSQLPSFAQHGAFVEYVLAYTSNVILAVYDQLGRLMYRSSNPHQEIGWHAMYLSGTAPGKNRLGQGIYAYAFTVTGGGKQWTRNGRFCVLR